KKVFRGLEDNITDGLHTRLSAALWRGSTKCDARASVNKGHDHPGRGKALGSPSLTFPPSNLFMHTFLYNGYSLN
ncbi:MAG: hypothetical protein LBC52_06285, partial [Treponema sp.]|nr:hypothetical protein [Treponema sp.]